MNVRELTQEQLDQLKFIYYYQLDETDDEVLGDDIWCACDIPNDVIFEHYDGINFVEEDFFN